MPGSERPVPDSFIANIADSMGNGVRAQIDLSFPLTNLPMRLPVPGHSSER